MRDDEHDVYCFKYPGRMSCYGDTKCSLCKDETKCNLEMKMRCGRLGVCMYYRPKLVSDVKTGKE
ncbi:MAG: hypothetical protein KBT67_03950 [bacterium]|nr:hypothetical protein [Candidatus Limimorpha caballi]